MSKNSGKNRQIYQAKAKRTSATKSSASVKAADGDNPNEPSVHLDGSIPVAPIATIAASTGGHDTIPPEAAQTFLESDFNQCFEQMRHYEGQVMEIVKFTFTAYTGLIAAAVGLYQFSKEKGIDLVPVAMAILAVGLLFGLFMLALLVRNRVYFALVARYVNEHRAFFLEGKPLGFANNARMYTSVNHPQFFNWASVQAVHLYLMATLNAVLLFGLLWIQLPTGSSLGFSVALLAGQLAIAIRHLKSREGKSANRAAFGTE